MAAVPPILPHCAALSHKSPFQKLNDVHAIRQQHRMRLQFAIDSESDFVALMRAFECWIDEGMSQRRWAEEHHLNFEAMKMIDRILRDFDMRISRTTEWFWNNVTKKAKKRLKISENG